MREKDLDRAFGNTPPAFTGRIHQTLAQLEDKPRRIPRLRAALIVAAVLALLCGIAYAVIMQGQAWYYNNRFTAYQEHEPEKHQAIMQNLQTDLPQAKVEDPEIAIAIVAEKGGGGTELAAVAADILSYYFNAEDTIEAISTENTLLR